MNHLAAIHVLKSKLQMSDDDYRALLVQMTGQNSSKLLNDRQRQTLRDHMQGLADRMGVTKPSRSRPLTAKRFAEKKAQATPKERKVWALWNQLYRDGKVRDNSAQALGAWVQRTVHVSSLAWCSEGQLNTLIEALKEWQEREISNV